MHIVPGGGGGARGKQEPSAGKGRKAAADRAKAVRRTGGVLDHFRLPDVASVSKECEVRYGHIVSCTLLVYPLCYVLAFAGSYHTDTLPQRSDVLAHSGRQLCDARQCMHAQALESCLVYFCDFAAASKDAAATLVKELGGNQVCAPNNHAAQSAPHDGKTRLRLTIFFGVTERDCCTLLLQ